MWVYQKHTGDDTKLLINFHRPHVASPMLFGKIFKCSQRKVEVQYCDESVSLQLIISIFADISLSSA